MLSPGFFSAPSRWPLDTFVNTTSRTSLLHEEKERTLTKMAESNLPPRAAPEHAAARLPFLVKSFLETTHRDDWTVYDNPQDIFLPDRRLAAAAGVGLPQSIQQWIVAFANNGDIVSIPMTDYWQEDLGTDSFQIHSQASLQAYVAALVRSTRSDANIKTIDRMTLHKIRNLGIVNE